MQCYFDGNIRIGSIVMRYPRSEIGYMISDRVTSLRAYMTEKIREFCRCGFEALDLAKLAAGVYDAHKVSAKAPLKVGFFNDATISSYVFFEGRSIASSIFGLARPGRAVYG